MSELGKHEKAFLEWIDQCPEGIHVEHDFIMVSDLTPHQKIKYFHFTIPTELEES